MAVHTAPAAPEAGAARPRGADSHEPLGPLRRTIREVGLGLITLGVITFLFVGYQLWGTGIAEAHSQAHLKKAFNTAVATHHAADSPAIGPAPAGGTSPANAAASPAPGGAVAHLLIPRIGVNVIVVEGVSEAALRQGPGHYPQTPLPGQKGNTAIAGHRTTYGAPFYSIDQLRVGDAISLTDTAGRTFVYDVSESPRVVSPSDVSVLDPTPFAQLTLTTCNPRFSATSRLVVVARLTNRAPLPVTPSPAQTSAPRPQSGTATVSATNTLGSGNSGAWGPTLLYGGLFVLLWIGVRLWINRTRRWARVGAFVVGIGVCLIPLWFCFENVVRLLPQNI